MKSFNGMAVGLALIGMGGAAQAQDDASKSPAIREMAECRGIADVSARAGCYDRAFDRLQGALSRREVVVVDRAELTRTRKSLFGLNLPKLDLFSRGQTKAEEAAFETFTGKIAQASRTSQGRWAFVLEDEARWNQIDDEPLAKPARANDEIRIRKGAMGSFLANVAGQRAIRVRRIN